MKIILLSAYGARSHRCWRGALVKGIPQVEWTCLSLPPRYFAWRVRGNPLSWFDQLSTIDLKGFDAVLATSMVDSAVVRGLFPELALKPWTVYFHENQFEYPGTDRQVNITEAQLTSVYSALAADQVVFNTNYNRQSFLAGARTLLAKMPDRRPADCISLIEAKTHVVPVPVQGLDQAILRSKKNSLPELVWNHRWEYDKGPELLLETLQQLDKRNFAMKVHVIGEQFRSQPAAFAAIESLLNNSLCLHKGQWGFLDNAVAYRQLLGTSDIVLSTASHDFQGIAIMEAVALGCLPVVPDRLAYPEIFKDEWRYGTANEARQAAKKIIERAGTCTNRKTVDIFNEDFWLDSDKIIGMYRKLLNVQ